MRRTIIALILLAALGAAGTTGLTLLPTAQASSRGIQSVAQLETRTFAVKNMTCPLCRTTVRKAMERVDGVKSVSVDLDSKTATVVYDPAVATPEAIAQASANAGYPARLARLGG